MSGYVKRQQDIDELAAHQARYDARALAEGLPAIKFWLDPCRDPFETERDAEVFGEALAEARARREAEHRKEQP